MTPNETGDAKNIKWGGQAKQYIKKKVYSVPELARAYGLSTSSAYVWVKQPGFPVLHIGKRKVIPISALEKWIEDHTGNAEVQTRA